MVPKNYGGLFVGFPMMRIVVYWGIQRVPSLRTPQRLSLGVQYTLIMYLGIMIVIVTDISGSIWEFP